MVFPLQCNICMSAYKDKNSLILMVFPGTKDKGKDPIFKEAIKNLKLVVKK